MVFVPTAQAAYYFFASNPAVIIVLKKQKNNKLRHTQNKNQACAEPAEVPKKRAEAM
jgi:hypothetical protein